MKRYGWFCSFPRGHPRLCRHLHRCHHSRGADAPAGRAWVEATSCRGSGGDRPCPDGQAAAPADLADGGGEVGDGENLTYSMVTMEESSSGSVRVIWSQCLEQGMDCPWCDEAPNWFPESCLLEIKE